MSVLGGGGSSNWERLRFYLPPRVFAHHPCSLALLQLLGGDSKSLPPLGTVSDVVGISIPLLSQACTGHAALGSGDVDLLPRKPQMGGKARAVLRCGCQKKKKKELKKKKKKFPEKFSFGKEGGCHF